MILGGIVGGYYGIDGGGGKNPVSYYYGKGQTQTNRRKLYTRRTGITIALAEFKTTADLTYEGGKDRPPHHHQRQR